MGAERATLPVGLLIVNLGLIVNLVPAGESPRSRGAEGAPPHHPNGFGTPRYRETPCPAGEMRFTRSGKRPSRPAKDPVAVKR